MGTQEKPAVFALEVGDKTNLVLLADNSNHRLQLWRGSILAYTCVLSRLIQTADFSNYVDIERMLQQYEIKDDPAVKGVLKLYLPQLVFNVIYPPRAE